MFIGSGILLFILGGVLCYCGNAENNNMDAQMESFFNNGKTNPGDGILIFGALLIVVGIGLVIYGIYREADRISEKNGLDVVGAEGYKERIEKIESGVMFGKCEMCDKESTDTRLCVLKGGLGTRYRYLCDECIVRYKNSSTNRNSVTGQASNKQESVIGKCQLCEEDDVEISLFTMFSPEGNKNRFVCKKCMTALRKRASGDRLLSIDNNYSVIGQCQQCNADDVKICMCSLQGIQGIKNRFLCSACIKSYDNENNE